MLIFPTVNDRTGKLMNWCQGNTSYLFAPTTREKGGVKVRLSPTFTPPNPLFIGTHLQE